VFILVPSATIINMIGYWFTLCMFFLVFGCFIPEEIIMLLASMEFMMGMLLALLRIAMYIMGVEE
jgi:hypothetical protein